MNLSFNITSWKKLSTNRCNYFGADWILIFIIYLYYYFEIKIKFQIIIPKFWVVPFWPLYILKMVKVIKKSAEIHKKKPNKKRPFSAPLSLLFWKHIGLEFQKWIQILILFQGSLVLYYSRISQTELQSSPWATTQDQSNFVWISKFFSVYLKRNKNKFKNLIRTSKF